MQTNVTSGFKINGTNPYVQVKTSTPLTNRDVKVISAEAQSCLRTGNPECLARMGHQRSHGNGPRVATNFGCLNASGGIGLTEREMNMAKDLAEQKMQIAQLMGQAVPAQQECIQPYLPSNVQQNSHPVPPGTDADISFDPMEIDWSWTMLIRYSSHRLPLGQKYYMCNATVTSYLVKFFTPSVLRSIKFLAKQA